MWVIWAFLFFLVCFTFSVTTWWVFRLEARHRKTDHIFQQFRFYFIKKRALWLVAVTVLSISFCMSITHSRFDTESSSAQNCKQWVCFPELPRPNLGDLSDMRAASVRLRRKHTPNVLGFSFSDLCCLDNIKVELVPEKKGLILKHVEYEVTSLRFKSTVLRRYNDFVALYEMVMMRFPYRILPKLPPKKMLGGKNVVLLLFCVCL